MAYIKSLLLTDVFPNADFNTGTSTFEIPLSDLTGVGLDLTEATAEDARKFVMAIIQKTVSAQATIATAYATSLGLTAYTAGSDYDTGDKVRYNNLEYEANKAITNAPATFNTADWDEVNVKQPVENFGSNSGRVTWAQDGSTGTQSHSINVTYSNEYDIKDE